MNEQFMDGVGEGQAPVNEIYLTNLFKELCQKMGGARIYQKDCPTSEHVAGYYIDGYGGLDDAINGVRDALSGQQVGLTPFSGDERVLEILEQAKLNQEQI